ncbi:N-acetylmuramoyl-L-alanine amidase [Brevibacterium salitolerans]|uniref:N-acetylmuramoyl-L-alanine amidase n=1 Tax=Brevibacterium salitolerans TaxID=1403566 RepID=A0ABP5ITU7_9MICO
MTPHSPASGPRTRTPARRCRTALGAAAAALAFGLAGCGTSGGEDSSAAPAPTAEAAGTSPGTEGTAPGPADASPSTAAEEFSGLIVAVDPGHNGGNAEDAATIGAQVPDGRGGTKACNTVGTSTDDGYAEHRFTWELATVLTERLEDAGAEVVLSRDSDDGVGPCVDERGAFAAEEEADVLVSLHANGSEDRSASGFHVIAAADGAAADDEAVAASQDLAGSLVTELEQQGLDRNPAYGRVVERSDLATLNHAAVPAVMLEAGEMRNADDAELLASSEGQDRIAEAIVRTVSRLG